MLILKATGRSCIACINDCCNILKANQKKVYNLNWTIKRGKSLNQAKPD